MREIRSYGSVRGVVGNRYPYRDLICSGKLFQAVNHNNLKWCFSRIQFQADCLKCI